MLGRDIYDLCVKMFPYCRSITGDGVRLTLSDLQKICPNLTIHEIPSGTNAFDWVIPDEWGIRDGWIKNDKGEKVLDFQKSNLHIMGYSAHFDKIIPLDELKKIIYTQEDQPEVVPYVTSYYKRRSGFCMSERQKNSLPKGNYHCFIDSEFKKGSLTYGEAVIKGNTEEEILLSTYVCHPSLANDNLSGPALVAYLGKWLTELPNRRYTYRLVFAPETIGALAYLSLNLNRLQQKIIAGFVVTCVGDDRAYSYIASRNGDTLSDRVAKNVLKFHDSNYKSYSFLERGSDERQYCAPGIDLPICGICRSKYGEFPEYHTSADNLNLISPAGLQGAFDVYKDCITVLENNYHWRINCLGEPQLGKRGLYPTISQKNNYDDVQTLTNFLAYADGKNDLIDISETIGIAAIKLVPLAKKLSQIESLPLVKATEEY